MAEEEHNDDTLTGLEVLEAAWWEAIDELRQTIAVSDSTTDRTTACDVLLSYTARMNQGLNAPFIPAERPPLEEDENEDD